MKLETLANKILCLVKKKNFSKILFIIVLAYTECNWTCRYDQTATLRVCGNFTGETWTRRSFLLDTGAEHICDSPPSLGPALPSVWGEPQPLEQTLKHITLSGHAYWTALETNVILDTLPGSTPTLGAVVLRAPSLVMELEGFVFSNLTDTVNPAHACCS